MNADYIYAVFESTEQHGAHDLTVGLAHLRAVLPIPAGMTDRGIREFMGRHYKDLVKAYQSKDKTAFAAAVAQCEAEDAAAQEDADDR